MDENLPVLNLYGQNFWHQDAYVVANRHGLEELRAGIEEALTKGASQVLEVASDGEGYYLQIQLIDNPLNSDEWENAALPYTEEDAREKREDAVWPWDRDKRK